MEDVDCEEELQEFVIEAMGVFSHIMGSAGGDVVRLRSLFRLIPDPPVPALWRHLATYIYIMDDRGNVIFNGANRNIEQTNLLDLKDDNGVRFIQDIIAKAKES